MYSITEALLHWMGPTRPNNSHTDTHSEKQTCAWTSVNTIETLVPHTNSSVYRHTSTSWNVPHMWTLSCSSAPTHREQEKGCFFSSSLLDHTKEVSCGVEACEGIKGTKQADERGEARAKESAWMAAHVREALKKPILQPSEDWIAKEEAKSEVSSFSSLPLSLCLLSSPWARLTGGSACPLGSLERRPGVCVFWSLLNISCCCHWFH